MYIWAGKGVGSRVLEGRGYVSGGWKIEELKVKVATLKVVVEGTVCIN